jgi:hypothetical protein
MPEEIPHITPSGNLTPDHLQNLQDAMGKISGNHALRHKVLVQQPRSATMHRFQVLRKSPPPEYLKHGTANAADEVQFEGVVFSDGTVAVRWLTEFSSTSLWASLEDLERVHGHPEYETEWVWLDG